MEQWIRNELAVIKRELSVIEDEYNGILVRILIDELKKYNPNQPRVPSGNANGGQWTRGGGGSGGGSGAKKPSNKLPKLKPTLLSEAGQNEARIFIADEPVIPPGILRPNPLSFNTPKPANPVKPPLDKFPDDITKPPGPGWVWKGKGKKPGGPEGNWVNPKTKEKINPDLDHGPPQGPHLDYKTPRGKWYRWYPDGRIEPKKPATLPTIDELS